MCTTAFAPNGSPYHSNDAPQIGSHDDPKNAERKGLGFSASSQRFDTGLHLSAGVAEHPYGLEEGSCATESCYLLDMALCEDYSCGCQVVRFGLKWLADAISRR